MRRGKLAGAFAALLVVMAATSVAVGARPALADSTLFSENFDEGRSGGLDPLSGACTSAPCPAASWMLLDADGAQPIAGSAFVGASWSVHDEAVPPNESDNDAAFSTSAYDPPAQADDWMWTPQITLQPHATLRWRAMATDPDHPDGYEVRVIAGDPPLDSAQAVQSSTLVFVTGAEETAWRSHGVDLQANGFTSGNIRVGFRNNSVDRYLLEVDDVRVATDTIAPDPPVLDQTSPASPSRNDHPRVMGSEDDPEATIRLYASSDCSGTPIGLGTVSDLTEGGISVTVPQNQTTSISATATDLASNTSACSNAISYTHDGVAPTVTITIKKRVRAAHKANVTYSFVASEPSTFMCATDGANAVPCSSPNKTGKVGHGKHTVTVTGTDAANNTGSATASFRVVPP